MNKQLERSIIRAVWAIFYSGISQVLAMMMILTPEQVLALNWKLLIAPFLTGILMGLKKYTDWQDASPTP